MLVVRYMKRQIDVISRKRLQRWLYDVMKSRPLKILVILSCNLVSSCFLVQVTSILVPDVTHQTSNSTKCFETFVNCLLLIRVATQTGKMGRHFHSGKKSGNFKLTGKCRGNKTQYWKTLEISGQCYFLFY